GLYYFERVFTNAPIALARSAGGGIRTRTPPKGTPDFKSGAYDQFRHPGGRRIARPNYVFGAMSLTLGNRSPALFRWLSRNFASAASSNAVHVSTYPFPGFTSLNEPSCLYLGSFQAAA